MTEKSVRRIISLNSDYYHQTFKLHHGIVSVWMSVYCTEKTNFWAQKNVCSANKNWQLHVQLVFISTSITWQKYRRYDVDQQGSRNCVVVNAGVHPSWWEKFPTLMIMSINIGGYVRHNMDKKLMKKPRLCTIYRLLWSSGHCVFFRIWFSLQQTMRSRTLLIKNITNTCALQFSSVYMGTSSPFLVLSP